MTSQKAATGKEKRKKIQTGADVGDAFGAAKRTTTAIPNFLLQSILPTKGVFHVLLVAGVRDVLSDRVSGECLN